METKIMKKEKNISSPSKFQVHGDATVPNIAKLIDIIKKNENHAMVHKDVLGAYILYTLLVEASPGKDIKVRVGSAEMISKSSHLYARLSIIVIQWFKRSWQ
jgi:hypothetical protein